MIRMSLIVALVALGLPPSAGTPQASLDGRSFPVAPGVLLEVRDIPGPIHVITDSASAVSVRIARTATSAGAAIPVLRADQRADRIVIYGTPVEPDDDRRVQVVLRVPAFVRLDIRRVKGEVHVTGAIEGSLAVYDVAGAIDAVVRGLEPVRIANVSGSVRLRVDPDRGRRNIEIGRVSGAINIAGR